MAGDKHFFYHVNRIRKETGIGLNMWCSNPLENTDFKVGLAAYGRILARNGLIISAPETKCDWLHIT